MRSIQISNREKLFIIWGFFALVFIAIFYVVLEFRSELQILEEKKINALNDKSKLHQLSIEYQKLKNISKDIKSNNLGIDLTTEVENLLRQSNIPNNQFFLKPSSRDIEKKIIKDEVRITLPEIPARSLLSIVQSIENNAKALLNIDYFQARPLQKKKGYYTASLTVVSYKNK